MKYLRPLLCLIAFPTFLLAQSNYKPGYVVTAKGDTIKGFVDYREWDETPLSINFKKSISDNTGNKYLPGDIRYFSVDMAEAYQSYTGPISTDPTATDKIATGRDSSFKTATVFFKVLEKGDRLALYKYKDEIKERYFIAEAPDYAPKELVYRMYNDPNFASNMNPNASKLVTENTFQKQLSGAALKNNELNDNLEAYIGHSEYSENDILKIVSKINHISKTDFKKTRYAGSTFNIFIGAGVDINSTSPDNGGSYYAAGGRSYTSYGPQGMIGINLFANPATRALQFRLEISGASIKYQSEYMSKLEPYVPTEVNYNDFELAVSPQVIYNFYNTDKFKVFAGMGFSFFHSSYSNAYFGSQNHDGSVAYVAASNPFQFKGGDNAFLLKAGVQFTKNLAIVASYHTTINNTDESYFKLTSTGLQIGLNYFFQ